MLEDSVIGNERFEIPNKLPNREVLQIRQEEVVAYRSKLNAGGNIRPFL